MRAAILVALLAAALFGASTPIAKLLLRDVDPWMLAALLYLGAGIGLALIQFARQLLGIEANEAPLRKADLKWLAPVILAGGVLGPVFLMLGLARTPAASAALLLNLEGLATMAIAWVVFRENVDRRLLLGAFAILAGAALLSWQGSIGQGRPGQGSTGLGPGAGFIALACLCWGIDNNLTRKLSAADPLRIAMVKGLAAGSVNLILALGQGARLPAAHVILGAGLVGFFGYGISLMLFVLSLRQLGTARTGAYFSLAPFAGALLALPLLGEHPSLLLLEAAGLMGAGLWLHLTERHEHEHGHEESLHEHSHMHDAHHQHAHPSGISENEPHSHVHRHSKLVHRHRHYPDLHHRHSHEHVH